MATPNPSNHPTDEQLLERARGGDREAFADLVRRYETPVYSMSFRMLSHREDARDLAQEIFLTVYQSLERFRGEAQFKTWLYRVTVNRCRDELRKRKTVKHTQPASLASLAPDEEGRVPEPPGREPSPEAAARAAELEARIERAIAELPEELRETVLLRDVQDLSYDEIAAVLAVPVGTVRSRLSRARQRLADDLAPMVGDEA